MKRNGILLIILFFSGCAAHQWNIDWVREKNISIIEVEVHGESWHAIENFLNSYNSYIANPNTVTMFIIPIEHWDKTLIKYHVDLVDLRATCFFNPPRVIFRMGKYPCVEHELGHLREYLEGVPYHSKYAPDNFRMQWRWFSDPSR